MYFGGSQRAMRRGWVGVECWLLMWKGEIVRLCGRSWGGLVVLVDLEPEAWCSCWC